jgi:hypothetical protein
MNEAPDLSRANWVKSSYSNGQGGACVECAVNLPRIVAVRDSKAPDGRKLLFSSAGWQRFTVGIKAAC